MIRIRIDSTDVEAQSASYSITEQGGEASLAVLFDPAEAAPQAGQSVDIVDVSTDEQTTLTLWSGQVAPNGVVSRGLSSAQRLVYDVRCDYVTGRLQDILVWMRETDQTVKTWFTNLVSNWLSGEGFTLTAEDGPKVEGARVFAGRSAFSVLREHTSFASQSGYTYRVRVTPAKVIHFEEEDSATSAPFNITDEEGRAAVGSLTVNPEAGAYANIFIAEGLPGALPERTYELTRKEGETLYHAFGDRVFPVTRFTADGVAASGLAEKGVDDTDSTSFDIVTERGGYIIERLNTTSNRFDLTESIEFDAKARGIPSVLVMDPDEITARGRIWGETFRVEAHSVKHLVDQALAELDARSRRTAERVRYTVDMVPDDVLAGLQPGASVLGLSSRLEVGMTQTITRTSRGLSAWQGRVVGIQAEVRSPSLVAYTVDLWDGKAAPQPQERAATLSGVQGGAKDEREEARATEPTLSHPAIFDPEVIETTASTWTFTAA